MKINLILFAIGLALGLFLSFMYCTLRDGSSLDHTGQKPVAVLKKEVQQRETVYTKKVDSLESQNIRLTSTLRETKSALQATKQRGSSLQHQAYRILNEGASSSEGPSFERDTACAKLKLIIADLMNMTSQSDSLYECMIQSMGEQLRIKDSTIQLQEEQYKTIKAGFEGSIKKVEGLEVQNKALSKQSKKQRFKSKVLSAVLLLFSGAALNHLNHH